MYSSSATYGWVGIDTDDGPAFVAVSPPADSTEPTPESSESDDE